MEQEINLSHLLNKNEQIRWYEIFESVDTQLEISFKKTDPKTLAAALKGLKPFVEREEITLDLFVDNITYLKAAYLLGVRKYKPRFKDDTLALAILDNETIASDDKQHLFEWMLHEKMYATNPLPIARICKALIKGDCSIGCLLRLPLPDTEDFPSPNPDVDSDETNKQNILHAAVYNGGILEMWKSLQRIFSTEELVQMLLQKNKRNRSALFLILSNYLNPSNRMPKEIAAALVAIAKSGNFALIKEFDMIQQNFEKSSMIHLLYKFGMTPDKIPPITNDQPKQFYHSEENPFELAHRSYRWKNSQATPENDTCQRNSDPATSFPIDQLLPELVWLIAEYLDPQGAVGLFSLNRKMAHDPIFKYNAQYWKRIYDQNYYPNWNVYNHKNAVRRSVVCSLNMLQRNFSTIRLEGFKATPIMDENWSVMYKGKDIYLWNCHTRATHLIWAKENLENPGAEDDPEFFKPITILGGKYDGTIPKILMKNDMLDTVQYGLIENGIFRHLFDIEHPRDLASRPQQISEHVVLFPNFALYDIRTWKKVVTETGTLGFTPLGVLSNPFNDTFLVHSLLPLNNGTKFQIYDQNQKLLRQFDARTEYVGTLSFITEDLVLYLKARTCRLIKISAHPALEEKRSIFDLGAVISPRSKDRIIFADARTGLVSICHLPSLEWEAVYHLQATLTVSNSRYFVGNDEGNFEISNKKTNEKSLKFVAHFLQGNTML